VADYTLNENPKKRKSSKVDVGSIFKIIGFIILVILAPILLAVLFKSEEGVSFLYSSGVSLVIKIVFTIALICVAFVKAEKISAVEKIVTLAYVVVYWLGITILPSRVSYIFDSLFGFTFLVFAFYDVENKKFNFNTPTHARFLVLECVVLLMVVSGAMSFTMLDDNSFLLETLIFVVITLIVGLIIIIKNINKNKTQTKFKKVGKITVSVICLIMGGFLFGYFGLLGANYAFDTSKPEVVNRAIINLYLGDDDSSSKATVVIDGKEIEVSISDAEYYSYKIGDNITLYKFKGAFNKAYVTTDEG
jgi:hypothetical protein